MSPGGILRSVGSGGEILSQASNYWAEPQSKDVLLIDYTSPTSNKTQVESVCSSVCGTIITQRFVSVCVSVFEKETDSKQNSGNIVCVNVGQRSWVVMPGPEGLVDLFMKLMGPDVSQ